MDEEGTRREALAMLRRGISIAEILDHRLRLRRAANEYVICTLSTARAELTVQFDGRPIGSYRHPIAEKVIRPLIGRGR